MTSKAQTQPLPLPAAGGLGAFLAETGALYMRAMRKLSRRPIALYFALIQPMVWLLLFGQIFSRITRFPGAAEAFGNTSYFQFFMPAVILQAILFGSGQTGLSIINDIDSGFLDKLLTTPINRMAILMGAIFGQMTRLLLQAIIIATITWIMGLLGVQQVRYAYGLPGVVGAIAIAMLFGVALAGLSVFIALRTRNTESTFLISNFLTLPLLFTSSAQLPLQLLPDWLQRVALLNPVTYTIDAMRVLLNGTSFIFDMDPALEILRAIAIIGLMASVTLTLAVRSFRRTVR